MKSSGVALAWLLIATLLFGCNSREPGALDPGSWREYCDGQKPVVDDFIRKLEGKKTLTEGQIAVAERARQTILSLAKKALDQKVLIAYTRFSDLDINLEPVLAALRSAQRPDVGGLKESMQLFDLTFPCSGAPPRQPKAN